MRGQYDLSRSIDSQQVQTVTRDREAKVLESPVHVQPRSAERGAETNHVPPSLPLGCLPGQFCGCVSSD